MLIIVRFRNMMIRYWVMYLLNIMNLVSERWRIEFCFEGVCDIKLSIGGIENIINKV